MVSFGVVAAAFNIFHKGFAGIKKKLKWNMKGEDCTHHRQFKLSRRSLEKNRELE